MRGIEVLQYIKTKVPEGTKRIICSGTLDKNRIIDAVKQGAHDFVTKPFDKVTISKVLNSI